VAECPVEAIYDEKDLPGDQKDYVALNARLAARWPLITQSTDPLPEAGEWADRQGKRDQLVEMS
jgi:ferredoxin